jgi:hypothetical protein
VLPGAFETDRFRAHVDATAKSKGISREPCLPTASAACRRGGSATRTSSARPAFLCSAHAGATSPVKICSWTAGFPGAF